MEGKDLNKEQLEAISHGEGPLLIIAGAGTGKTTVITERVKHLISTSLAKPSEILALTFTEKAALEMETRIDEALPLGYTQMSVMTFHGFCDSVLRESAIHVGLDPAYKLMTTAESVDLLKRNLFALNLSYFLPLGNPTKFLFGLLNHFSRLQDENINPSEYLEWAEQEIKKNKKEKSVEEKLELEKWLELATAYKKYDEIKIKNSLMDFGDLITKTLLLFTSRPNVLSKYKNKFKFILVDEFQDTNYSQNELAKFLAGQDGNITVVADDDQSIYRFRGAAVSNVLSFRKSFPKAKVVTLIKNYRSLQNILDASYSLINHNNPDRLEIIEKIDKKLVAERNGIGKIEFALTNRGDEEADFVAKKIIEIQKKKNLMFNDFAVLVRANNHADAFIRSFEQTGIPYQFLGPGKLYLESEITDLISYIKVITDISDDVSLYRVLSMDLWEIPLLYIASLSSKARRESLSLFELLTNLPDDVSSEVKEKIGKVITLVTKHLGESRNRSAGEILYEFVGESGMIEYFTKLNTPESVRSVENIAKFFGKVKSFENANPDASIRDVVEWISLQQDLGESPQAAEIDWVDNNAVNILTVHSAKGLEFPVVFLVNLVSQRFPGTNRAEQIPIPDALIRETLPIGDFHLEEERRLFYVGMTRARDELYMTAAKFYGEAKREKKVSQFVYESVGVEQAHTKTVETSKNKDEKVIVVKDVAKKPLFIKSLSYSQIETFIICPLHYKLRYLLNIPTLPTASQSFGISFHACLKSFQEEVKNGEKPSMDLMQKLLNDNWIKAGYLNKSHREESYKKAISFLEYYLEYYFDPAINTIALEQEFNTRLDGLSLRGKIDRIDEVKDGIHIIDYKTGAKAMTQKEADKSLQLSIYALAATKIKEYPFNRNPSDITLSLYYFDEPQIVTTHRTAKQLDDSIKEIYEWKKKIETSDFTCNGNYFCRDCEYKMYCKSETGD